MNLIAIKARLQGSRAGIHINIKAPTLPVIPATFSVIPAQAGIQWRPTHQHEVQA